MGQIRQFVLCNLRGIGQVCFMGNALTGLLFLLGICYYAVFSQDLALIVGVIIGVVTANLTAMLMKVTPKAIDEGLLGFNGALIGLAVPTFLMVSAEMWFLLIIGAMLTTVISEGLNRFLTKSYGVPASTGPFVISAWLLMSAAYAFGNIHIDSLSHPTLAMDYDGGFSEFPDLMLFIRIFFKNIAQIFLLDSPVSGGLILLGILLASVKAGIAAALGSLVSIFVAFYFGADPDFVKEGLYGFSPVLTAMALGVIFIKPSWKSAIYALMGIVITVIIQGSLDTLLLSYGIPSFTASYVFTMYLFMLAKNRHVVS